MTTSVTPSPRPGSRNVPADVQAASELLAALASPLRMSIVTLLDEHGSRCVHQLVDALGVPQPLVSQHLRVLRGAGLVTGVRRHREVDYRLVDTHVAHIVRDALAHAGHATEPLDTESSDTA
ncbi:ArsR/SmtB family transcription factor [Modestobacter sp. VKM Ac-2985]|uniref:ArsR/SmtB family transcription factor n=1 Tax=Modestobacter sp. VKM Ac-2985 TaxID=3004139 RepID=UPI0022AB7549|nr:metalloregulator ArsR/SmtB family transcription factor [Modestobacter sp. VKM Ac-2985]MCZ2837070.1 metalloregulator ArsR/SmtB family transcription factor [Modestobacter sp. VKM Ac-2985]